MEELEEEVDMTLQQDHSTITNEINRHLGVTDFDSITLTSENKYESWYATLLSSIALLISGEEVVYANINYGEPVTDVRIVVFTSGLVVVAEVDPSADGVPVARVVGRRSLVGMKLSASERIDARDRRSYEWPGMLNLVLTYSDLPDPIEIVTSGVNRYAVDKPTAIISLIRSLSADLAQGRQHGTE
jgi:hypothetical protein